jgi:lysine 2-monooxygenase
MDEAGASVGRPLDLAVVGGGVAGTFVTCRVSERRPDWAAALFEGSERVGGRLLSLRMPDIDGARAELGGMRYRTSQPIVHGLVQELGLETRPFLTVHDDNRFFLRGARWRAADLDGPTRAYRLDDGEPPLLGELLLSALERIVPGATTFEDDDWLQVKREQLFRGRPLREWSLRDALATVLTEEAHRFLVDGFGYADVLADRNAADAIPWILIEVRPESENRTLVDGMERLPRELVARAEAAGGRVLLGHHLGGLDHERGVFRLRFDGRPDAFARRVVLTLPRLALERLLAGSPLLDRPRLRSNLASVTVHPAAKLFLAYDRAWWRDAGLRARRTVSDLPLSKTYYFDRPEVAGSETPGLLLASYCDGPSRDAWLALWDGRGLPDDPGPYDADGRWERYAATERQVAEAQRHLRTLHERDDLPEPSGSAFVDWGADPFGGAWHLWNPGVRSWEVMEELLRPLGERDLYVCGEAYSRSQGWIEGALETAEQVVSRLTDRRVR